jgi:hypothetical protein
LIHLLSDASIIIKEERKYLVELIQQLEANPLEMHRRKGTGFPAIGLLAEKAKDEEYFTAYTWIFRGVIDAEKKFYRLKYVSLFLSSLLEQIDVMAVEGTMKDYDRRMSYKDTFNESMALLATISQVQQGKPDNPYYIDLLRTTANYLLLKDQSKISDIKDIQTHFIMPVRKFFEKPIQLPELISYSRMLDDVNYLYNDIIYQNNAMRKKLSQVLDNVDGGIIKLQEVVEFLSSQQLQSRYQ